MSSEPESDSAFAFRPEAWPRLSALLDASFDTDEVARAALIARTGEEDAVLGAELAALLDSPTALSSLPTAPGTVSAESVPGVAFTSLLNQVLLESAGVDSAGMRFGPWTLVARIGQGGMGEVWRAVRSDGLFQGSAAIKLLRSDLPAERLEARFARERAVLARLNHPNIARLLDAGVAHEQAYIVLELVDGVSLLAFAGAHAPTLAERVRLIRDVARAVEHAHSQLVLHRDLKPSNVLVTTYGTVKLLDFGIAAALDEASSADVAPNLTQLTGRGLTVEYAAPEQILGQPTVAASDVYSLGVMLFHLATGYRPFAGETNRAAQEFAAVHTDAPRASDAVRRDNDVVGAEASPVRAEPVDASHADQITPPTDTKNLKGDLDAIISKALRKSPAERYTTATAFAADLDAWLTQTPISIRAEDRGYRWRLWFWRNWKVVGFGAIAAMAIVVGLGVSLWQRSVAVSAAQQAKIEAAHAQDEALRATKVATYLGELIQSASPDKHGGKWPTVLALLAQSEKDIDKQFADDPKTLALLLKRLAETNDALNRDTVALAQWTQLQAFLEKTEPPDSDALLDARRQRAATSHRLRRFKESFAILDDLRTKIVTRFGKESEAHGKLLIQMVGPLTELGRIDDAKRALADGSTILTRLYPNDLAKRVALNDDTAAMLTKLGLWRQAMAKLEMVESDLPAYAKLSGVPAREVLIQQNNIEGVRVRLGLYAGTEARLKQILANADKLLGPDNAISADTLDFLAVLACETGRFADCLAHRRALVSLRKKQVGVEPGQVLAAEIDLLSVELALGRAVNPSAVEQLERIFAQIALRYAEPSLGRSYAYRTISDAATNADHLTLADAAQKRVRDDNIALNKMSAERVARLDMSIAATAFARGEAREAATLLTERFRVFSLTDEGDTPRRASLWLQKALYEVEFDLPAAAQSAAKGRAMFERVGTLAPQFKAVLAYIDARVSGNAAAIRAAETAIDQSYTRPKSLPWRAPFLSIM